QNGNALVNSATNTPLANGTYSVIVDGPDTIKLANVGDPTHTPLPITTNGVGTYSLTARDSTSTFVFTGTAVARNGVPANSITLGNRAVVQTGQAVLYRAGSGPTVGGLADNTVYYVIIPDPNRPDVVQLAATFQGALAGAAISGPFTNSGDGTQHSLTIVTGFQ